MCRREGGRRRKREKEINKAKMNLQELQQGCVIAERGGENLNRGEYSRQFAEEKEVNIGHWVKAVMGCGGVKNRGAQGEMWQFWGVCQSTSFLPSSRLWYERPGVGTHPSCLTQGCVAMQCLHRMASPKE